VRSPRLVGGEVEPQQAPVGDSPSWVDGRPYVAEYYTYSDTDQMPRNIIIESDDGDLIAVMEADGNEALEMARIMAAALNGNACACAMRGATACSCHSAPEASEPVVTVGDLSNMRDEYGPGTVVDRTIAEAVSPAPETAVPAPAPEPALDRHLHPRRREAVMDAKTLFNDKVPQALAEHPEKAREINAVYFFKITGDGGGEWTVDLMSNPPSCKPGRGATPGCSVELIHDEFKAAIDNPPLAMTLYFEGKLHITGDPVLATKLGKLLSMGG